MPRHDLRYPLPPAGHPNRSRHRAGRAIYRRLPVELHRLIDRYVQGSLPRIRASPAHLRSITRVNRLRNTGNLRSRIARANSATRQVRAENSRRRSEYVRVRRAYGVRSNLS
jgi:hypothetical protein